MSYKMFRFFDPKEEINFVRFFKPCLFLAFLIPIAAIISTLLFGLNLGIDFSGGTEIQVQFKTKTDANKIKNVLAKIGYEKSQIQPYGSESSNEMLIRLKQMVFFSDEDIKHIEQVLSKEFKNISIERRNDNRDQLSVKVDISNASLSFIERQQKKLADILNNEDRFKSKTSNQISVNIANKINNNTIEYYILFINASNKIVDSLSAHFGKVEIRKMDFVDSHVSSQLKTDGIMAVLYAILAILVYISIRFNLFFAPGAIICLIQDFFGAFLIFVLFKYEFDLPSVAALLTIVGVSINNTIVVYDRIRESVTLLKKTNSVLDYDEVTRRVNKAINDTLSRTINTTLTVLFSSISLWIFAGSVMKSFAVILTTGFVLGAFSSTFAAPAAYLFMVRNFQNSKIITHNGHQKQYSQEEKMRGIV